jgi:hypothetical protein
MSQDEEQQRRSRVVVETPNTRREVERTETSYTPERRGMSTGAVAAIAITAIAVLGLLFYVLTQRQSDATNTNVSVTTAPTPAPAQQPIIVQQPAQQPQQPVIIQQPAAQPAPVVVNPPASTTINNNPAPGSTTSSTTKSGGTDDLTIQDAINKKISADTTLAPLPLDILVAEGKVTLSGTVNTAAQKQQVEKMVHAVKGVKSVENQLIVSGGM